MKINPFNGTKLQRKLYITRNIRIYFDQIKFGYIWEAVLTGMKSEIREYDTVHMLDVNMIGRE